MGLGQYLHPRVRLHALALHEGIALPPDCTIAMDADGELQLNVPGRRPCTIEHSHDGIDTFTGWLWTYWTGREHAHGEADTAQAAVDAALAHMGVQQVRAIPGQLAIDGREVVATVGGTALVPSLFDQQLDLREPA